MIKANTSKHKSMRYDGTGELEAKLAEDIDRLLAEAEEGGRIYAKRKSTVESVFGIIKAPIGFRQFLLRGLEKLGIEWTLVCGAYNLSRVWALKPC